eukprot:8371092-Alexandrium_andersonii.AAC.1
MQAARGDVCVARVDVASTWKRMPKVAIDGHMHALVSDASQHVRQANRVRHVADALRGKKAS